MLLSLAPRCSRPGCHSSRRLISSSIPRGAQAKRVKKKDDEEEAAEAEEGEDGKTFKSFLKVNEKFRIASKPRNWLTPRRSEDTSSTADSPFPMNPSFKPPTPISDVVRNRMYADYMLDPETNSIRALSQRYHISLKRVEAILRLKGLEQAFVKGKPLQTGFQWGMEMLLGVKSQSEPERLDAHTADLLEESENRDAARQRFQRQYWESIVDDGKASHEEPILPAALERAKKIAERYAEKRAELGSTPRLMPRFKDTPTVKSPRQKVQTVVRPGRIPIQFIDVGGKFMNVDERLERMAMAERRNAMHAKKSEEKVLHGHLMGRTTVERARRAAFRRKQNEERSAAPAEASPAESAPPEAP
ncbi:eukaryotic mitochondrial regulator protein-domain-containing protein [Mycena crocata]|nr:eukaryotic mitochondrial regulator protein-domain-containing protein [Mycena crocata]